MKPTRASAALAAAILAALLGCSQESRPESSPQPVAAPEPIAADEPAADPQPPPAPATMALDSGDPTRGAQQYAVFCATCHGPRGEGDGPLAASLNPKPAKHSDGSYMNKLCDEHLYRVIKQGGPAVGKSPLMAPWGGSLRDEQIRDVMAFIRTLADPPYRP